MKMTKSMLKTKENEDIYIQKMATISGIEPEVIKEVFLTSLICLTLDMYNNERKLTVPYIGDILIEGNKLMFNSSNLLSDVINKTHNEDETLWVEDFLKGAIKRSIKGFLN